MERIGQEKREYNDFTIWPLCAMVCTVRSVVFTVVQGELMSLSIKMIKMSADYSQTVYISRRMCLNIE